MGGQQSTFTEEELQDYKARRILRFLTHFVRRISSQTKGLNFVLYIYCCLNNALCLLQFYLEKS